VNTKYTVGVFLIFVALVAAVAYLQRSGTESVDVGKGPPTPTAMPLVELEAAQVQEFTAQSPDGSVTLTRVAGGWEVNGQSAKESVDSTVTSLAKPAVVRELPEDRNPEDYGFATLSLTITLKTQDGTETVLEVGDDTPVGSDVYIRTKGASRIVTISNFDVNEVKGWITDPPLAPTPTPSAEATSGTPEPGVGEGTPAEGTALDSTPAEGAATAAEGTPVATATGEAGAMEGTPAEGPTAADEGTPLATPSAESTAMDGTAASSTEPSTASTVGTPPEATALPTTP
jgi:hypothetical protein